MSHRLSMRSARRSAVVLVLGTLGLGVSACAGASSSSSAPHLALAAVAANPADSLLASVVGRSISVYHHDGDATPYAHLTNPNRYGFPAVLLVKRSVPGALNVYLPQRPNGSTAWIRQADVRLTDDPYYVVVNTRKHVIKVTQRGHVILRTPIGVGRAVTPTPPGVYYLTDLFRLSDPNGPYGPYGFGLSAYSTVLHQFAGGDGQVGIHGTNDPSGLGRDVSHGCIRLANRDITKLAHILPLGTPVRIVR